jgi:integrase
VDDASVVFRRDDVPNRNWAAKTAEVYESVIRRISRGLGTRAVGTLTVKDCATFIREVTDSARSRQQFRLVMSWILACAVEEGWMDTNPVLQTRRHAHVRQRDRLTLDAYKAIWAGAEPWLRNAMDLSLLTLLRREDVVSVRFADVHDSFLWVIPQKTEGSSLVKLKIAVSEPLAALLATCRDDVVSAYAIHRLPKRARPARLRAKAREHHTQVLPEQLTREFAVVRDALGLGGKNAPTFHEVRSLGGALLQAAGWTLEQVQALMGHAEEAMTKLYLEGHEAPWQTVSTGIVLPR